MSDPESKKTNKPALKEALNFVPIPLSMYVGDEEISIGTAFFYEHASKIYLITNWHNVTGLEPVTYILKSTKTAALPNRLVVDLPFRKSTENSEINIYWEKKVLPLYENDDYKNPVWFEHPKFRDKVDVIAIELTDTCGAFLHAANAKAFQDDDLDIRPGIDVFVLGYPKGMTGGGKLPIWKRASLATEPSVDVDNLPKILIDTATREGMSGAPVFARIYGNWLAKGKPGIENLTFGISTNFLGIYSGRVGSDEFQAQLGVVWKEQAIIDVIEGATQGRSAADLSGTGTEKNQ